MVEPTASAIADAADHLRAGGVVAFPTETVYGLGADTRNPDAVERVYRIKGRPADNPLIAHVEGAAVARAVTRGWSARCDRLAERFWPGPLTLVLARAADISPRVTGGLPTIAVRSPRHDVALRLLAAFGGAVSAPSANRSGAVSPTTARHVADDLAGVEDLIILDGGRCAVGIESTVLDLTADPPRILRPGSVTIDELREVLGEVERFESRVQSASPGTSAAHYAPRTAAWLADTEMLAAVLLPEAPPAVVLCFDPASVPRPHRALVMPQGAADYARRLYEALREADAAGMERIIIERPPTGNEIWRAVHDRLVRATAGRELS